MMEIAGSSRKKHVSVFANFLEAFKLYDKKKERGQVLVSSLPDQNRDIIVDANLI